MITNGSYSYFRLIPITLILTGLNSENSSYAFGISNGDFNGHNFDGWVLNTDGLGKPTAGLHDFSLVQQQPGDSSARIEIDYYQSAGIVSSTPRDEAIFSNTLYQSLDFTLPPDQRWRLSFDWSFQGESSMFDDTFLVGLGDGSGNYFNQDHTMGFLLNPSAYGSGSFDTLLSGTYNDESAWTLEFQLNSGVDGYGSYVQIDNVDLTMQAIPLPGAFWLFTSSFITLIGLQKIKKI
jgi:hypothetical protein